MRPKRSPIVTPGAPRRWTPPPRRWPLLLASVVVTAGCGQSGDGGAAPVPTPPAVIAGNGSGALTVGALTAGELAGRIASSLRGVSTVTATISVGPVAAPTLTGTLALDTDASAADIDLETAHGSHDRVRIRDGQVYLRGPEVAPLARGRAWVRAGLDEVVGLAAAGASPQSAGEAQQPLPRPDRLAALLLGSLTPGMAHPAAVGTGPSYPLTMPLTSVDQLGAALGLSERSPVGDRLAAWTNRLRARGVTSLTGELVLARRGRPLRLVAAPAGQPAGADGVRVTFTSWGAPVVVAAPADEQVRDVSAADLANLRGWR